MSRASPGPVWNSDTGGAGAVRCGCDEMAVALGRKCGPPPKATAIWSSLTCIAASLLSVVE